MIYVETDVRAKPPLNVTAHLITCWWRSGSARVRLQKVVFNSKDLEKQQMCLLLIHQSKFLLGFALYSPTGAAVNSAGTN